MLKKIIANKFLAAVTLLGILGASYYIFSIFNKGTPLRYITIPAKNGTFVTSVAGSGQVSTSNQIDVKTKVSADVISIDIKEGSKAAAGTNIVTLNDSDARKTVRDAEVNLLGAKIALEKLEQSSADVLKITEDVFNDVSGAFLDFPTIVNDAETIILKDTISPGQGNNGFYKDFINAGDNKNRSKIELFIAAAENDYADTRSKYNQTFLLYKNTSRYSDTQTISGLLDKTVELSKSLAQTLKDEQNILDFLTDYASLNSRKLPPLFPIYQNTLRADIGKTNDHLSGLLDRQNTLKNIPLDIATQELAIKQKENALADAKENLSYYSIKTPFGGIVAKIAVKTGETVSANEAVATIITDQKLAEISLNEIDAAKVSIGEKATLDFDALPGVMIKGKVTEIDTLGTVNQGVVNFTVKISFSTSDIKIKPGMSVNAVIIIGEKEGVLLVPGAAIKSSGNGKYVDVLINNVLERKRVEIGLVNDTETEITRGLNAGDEVVLRTITSSASSTPTGQPQRNTTGFRLFNLPGTGGRRTTGQ